MTKIRIFGLILLQSLLTAVAADAQTIPVGMPGLDDSYRRAQLLGELDSTISFSIRPLSPGFALKDRFINVFDPDSTLNIAGKRSSGLVFNNNKGNLAFQILPL